MSQYFVWAWVWLHRCNTFISCFFSHSVVDLLLCLGTFSYCMVAYIWHWMPDAHLTWIFWYREVFTADSMSLRCLGPPFLHHRAWQLILGVRADMLCLLFALNRCALSPNIYSLVRSIRRILFQSSCNLFRCNFLKLSCACFLLLLFFKSFFLAIVLNIKT